MAHRAGGFRWEVCPEHRAALFGPGGLRLAEWLADGRAQVVKQAPHRTIYHVRLDGLSFYLKHYPVADLRGRLRQLVRPSKARGEYRKGLEVARRGVPTIVPLAVGERRSLLGAGESYLLTYSVDDAQPLSTFLETVLPTLPRGRQARLAERLATALGGLTARMHDAGILHHDFHAGNLLLRLDAEDRPTLLLIDLHTVALRRPLGWPASRANLVVLNHWFMLRVGRVHRLRFWHAYFAARGEAGRPVWRTFLARQGVTSDRGARALRADLARELEERSLASNLDFWRRRDKRCLRKNRYYRPVKSGRATGHALATMDAAALAGLAADPDEPFRRPGVRLLKDSRSSTVAELSVPCGGRPRAAILKRFRVTAWSDPWAALFRPTGALRSWVNGHGLWERLLPTARPLAVLHRRRLGLCYEGYLLTEKIEGALELHPYLARLRPLDPGRRRHSLRLLIDKVAALVRELHRDNLSHRDLKAANLLVVTGAAREPNSVWLIDLVGMRRHGKLAVPRKVQNLTRLNASFHLSTDLTRTDRLRFLRTYLQWGLAGRGTWKSWWRAVARATRTKVDRNLRVGRPLA